MNLDLTGRCAIVCGASQGIGLAAARELASLGASVTLLSRSPDTLKRRADELPTPASQHHDTLPCDLADHRDLADRVDQHLRDTGRAYHILVNNTGGPPAGRAIDREPQQYLDAFNAHLLSAHVLVRALLPAMRDAQYGRVINVTSTSIKAPIQNLGISNTVRGAVANWAKSLSLDLGPDGITVNNVLPGFTETDRLASLVETWAEGAGVTPDEWAQQKMQTIPLRRFATPEEVAAAIAFLASPAAAYISGINLPVDGGRLPTL